MQRDGPADDTDEDEEDEEEGDEEEREEEGEEGEELQADSISGGSSPLGGSSDDMEAVLEDAMEAVGTAGGGRGRGSGSDSEAGPEEEERSLHAGLGLMDPQRAWLAVAFGGLGFRCGGGCAGGECTGAGQVCWGGGGRM